MDSLISRNRRYPSPSAGRGSRKRILFAAVGLVAASLLAYQNSVGVPFLFDDIPAIVENASIRQLWPLSGVLLPDQDGGITSSGRPLVNLSLALNYAISGSNVWSYHVVNVFIHAVAGLLLFGIVRRTCLQPGLSPRWREGALPISLTAAAIWMLHPLQTESVTYVIQRAEALVGLFYLLTLYAFIRGCESHRSRQWFVAAVVACLAGMASKEVMVSAPLLVFLYDRTFVAGTFREAWRRRGPVHLALAATWGLLIALVASNDTRGGTVGFETVVSPFSYAATQARAVVLYLRLSAWPHPLVFDYGTGTVSGWGEVWLQVLLLLGLALGTMAALRHRPIAGFIGAWFFVILAPSSSIVPVASQTMAEHRMYLALAAPATLAAVGLYRWLGRRGIVLGLMLATAGAIATARRNADYASDLTLWSDTVAKQPNNPRAHHNLGQAALEAGRVAAAIDHYGRALQLAPSSADTHYNRGLAYARLGRWPEAVACYENALRLQAVYPEAHNNLGNALLQEGRIAAAAGHYRTAVRQRPDFAEAHSNLANAALELEQVSEAIRHAEEAVRLAPDYAEGHYNLGNAFAASRRFSEAEREYQTVLSLTPNHAGACANLGNVLLEQDRVEDAIEQWRQALRRAPDFTAPRRNLAFVLARLGRRSEAIEHFQALLELTPADHASREALERLVGQP